MWGFKLYLDGAKPTKNGATGLNFRALVTAWAHPQLAYGGRLIRLCLC